MIRKIISSILLAFLLLVAVASHANDSSWIDQSDKVVTDYIFDMAKFEPEAASSLGYRDFDSKAFRLTTDIDQQKLAVNQEWKRKLEQEIKKAQNSDYRIDLKVLLSKVNQEINNYKLSKKYGVITFHQVSLLCYISLRTLINEQAPAERKRAAVDRFKAYVNGFDNVKPLAIAAEELIRYENKKYQSKTYPYETEIAEYLSNSPSFVQGVKTLLESSTRDDWRADFDEFQKQVKKYDEFVRSNLLPRANKNYKKPKELYVNLLAKVGVNETPENLIKQAKKDYSEMYLKYKNLAKELAKKYKLTNDSPVAVAAYFRQNQITAPEDVKRLYEDVQKSVEEITKKHRLVSLPNESVRIRISGDAESKASPVPHMVPPPFVNNHGEKGEFVVPSSSDGKALYADFSYKEIAYALVAHEGRPGHELQFATILNNRLKNRVSIMRSSYAVLSANAEGWAMEAESLVYPYLTPEQQFPATQSRLWRMARMFLDPEVNLGLIDENQVLNVLIKEVGITEMAKSEFRRYSFDSPGQATSYYYGYLKIHEMKQELKKKLKSNYSELCVNDAILSFGFIPLDIMREELLSKLTCPAQ